VLGKCVKRSMRQVASGIRKPQVTRTMKMICLNGQHHAFQHFVGINKDNKDDDVTRFTDLRERCQIVPDRWVTLFAILWEVSVPSRERSVTERLRLVAILSEAGLTG
jgi:hypothetical protein